ncbi:hypothetical protein RSC2_00712 [Bacillus paralicheniformis]|nr:hypothetical protein RSC1_03273 [Bacillus paralicheniformis]BCE08916.1 hypothetical protein RSC2_00712 [Bacillus paralicheniformis]BCE15044.1 hypothetical protein RSC3_02400 [Bacillus paralicheniformis]
MGNDLQMKIKTTVILRISPASG